VCPPRNNHQAVQTHEPGPSRTPPERRASAESCLTVKSKSHRREFRLARALPCVAPPSARGLAVLRFGCKTSSPSRRPAFATTWKCWALSAARDESSRASLHEPHISPRRRECPRWWQGPEERRSARRGASNKPIERLVPVSSDPHGSCTPGLSTWWSTTALKGYLISREASRLDAFSGYPVRT
jgi:hypothetical protein